MPLLSFEEHLLRENDPYFSHHHLLMPAGFQKMDRRQEKSLNKDGQPAAGLHSAGYSAGGQKSIAGPASSLTSGPGYGSGSDSSRTLSPPSAALPGLSQSRLAGPHSKGRTMFGGRGVHLGKGPSLEWASRQDRFRQMMKSMPTPAQTEQNESNIPSRGALMPRPADGTHSRVIPVGGSLLDLMPYRPPTTGKASSPNPDLALSMPLQVEDNATRRCDSDQVKAGATRRRDNGRVRAGAARRRDGGRVKDGGRGGPGKPPAMMLSEECQKRRFNPKFIESMLPGGKWKCSVDLNCMKIEDTRSFGSRTAAKDYIASQGLMELRKFPFPPEAIQSGKSAPTKNKNALIKKDDASTNSSLHRLPLYDGLNDNDKHHLIAELIESMDGLSHDYLSTLHANSVASQAFLDGFALGSRLQGSAQRPGSLPGLLQSHGESRRRERSPAPTPENDYRARSPVRPMDADFPAHPPFFFDYGRPAPPNETFRGI
ncbi:hypothetical protein AAE478_009657 [Parahypoxylon ruwenzoriense]